MPQRYAENKRGSLSRSYSGGLAMKLITVLFITLAVNVPAPALSQDASTIERLNAAIREANASQNPSLELGQLPAWGVAVKDQRGEVVDLFGQVQYDVTPAGNVVVPGYVAPVNAKLEVVPQNELANLLASGKLQPQLQAQYKPLADLPGAVGIATEFLANEFCGKKNRPSAVSLSLVAGAGGTLFFATATS